MSKEIDARTSLLLGEDNLAKLHSSIVAIFGLGGVGGTAYEALVRAGVGTIYAVDKDVVELSNLNRQILFKNEDVGKKKAQIASLLASKIRDDVKVVPEDYLVSEMSLKEHDYSSCTYLFDCLDDIGAKIALIKYSLEKKIPLIVSLGMGNRLDPSQVYLTTLDKTEGDPLAKKLRNELRKEGIPLKNIQCVLSKELPLCHLPHPASLMMVPSEAGLLMASTFIKYLVA
jgi:tRNA threonylcarbamoyladenosine dehydratase